RWDLDGRHGNRPDRRHPDLRRVDRANRRRGRGGHLEPTGRHAGRPGGESMTPPVIERWLRFATSGDAAELDALLDDDVVFYSPAVFTPQEGRLKASAY